ncbi:FAD-dependent oxidoreductase [Halalkalibacter okhensis]|uniref:Oxidoreductase n=1 Tax=Halalkalibacter okhensis TaxID=333138 RepID=A0A0B0IAY9_9BACI|nr:FAD-dependent oxidoreductase [Halalkalibacter okhensis]KHF38032.1 oxidoreductase [Halalkalibacter okhensis]
MGLFQDIVSMFKKRELKLIESYEESNGVYSFLFEKETDVTWKAGQHGLFTITHKKIKNPTRPLSVASSPTENVIKLTMAISDNPSEFKNAMLELNQGMKVSMSGPVGSFYLQDNSPSLFIAGGIGITPFRAILKQIEAEGNVSDKNIHLLYLDSKKSYIFKDELDGLANNSSSISVTYLDSRDDLHEEIDKFVSLQKNNAKYFVAGPKTMADSVSAYLKDSHISKRNIKKDAFFGY